jgi:hypothetical protein
MKTLESQCNELNVCAFQNSYVIAPSVMRFGSSYAQMRSWGLVSLDERKMPKLTLSTISNKEGGPHQEVSLPGTLILDILVSRTVKNKHLLLLAPGLGVLS